MKCFVLNGWAAGPAAWDLCKFRRERVFSYTEQLDGLPEKELAAKLNTLKSSLPSNVDAGGHGGSHAYLTDDFIRSILIPGHKVCCDLKTSLDTTIAGVYAHKSALLGGETLKIPQISC